MTIKFVGLSAILLIASTSLSQATMIQHVDFESPGDAAAESATSFPQDMNNNTPSMQSDNNNTNTNPNSGCSCNHQNSASNPEQNASPSSSNKSTGDNM